MYRFKANIILMLIVSTGYVLGEIVFVRDKQLILNKTVSAAPECSDKILLYGSTLFVMD